MIVIMYRTAQYAYRISSHTDNESLKKDMDRLVKDFNDGDHYATEVIETAYSIIKE